MPSCPLLKLEINLSKTEFCGVYKNPLKDQMAILARCFTGMAFSHSQVPAMGPKVVFCAM
ncbi:hypothetical protein I79_025583 [Cricetulus griseus]|uniref:Uncharacterized protein n=1 Tax=Cricetulus griseus TaxID=10029 RepID=G3INQ2_CRIGR|nr:hypothetical protein I79_025583 [Cricetulus griseus]